MSNTGKQSPLGVNVQGSILNNEGFTINPIAASYMGSSKTNDDYTFGSLVQNTVLRLQTLGINDGYLRNLLTRTTSIDTYDNLINIGADSIPAMGNSKPPTYDVADPSGIWSTTAQKYGEQKGVTPTLPGPANAGYALTTNIDEGQQATWFPYTGVSGDNPNTSISQWGYIRLHALQAWNEFNWNGEEVDWSTPEYKEFTSSFLNADSFVNTTNQNIFAMQDSKSFLEGTYSNMNDLITSDIAGVSLATWDFGTDLINLGNAIDLSTIDSFGLPSNLLKVLYQNSALTQDLVYVLLGAGIPGPEIDRIAQGQETSTTIKTEQLMYGCFSLITGDNLIDILALLNCKTENINTLADLLSVKKLFPISYQTLTVPIYNTVPNPNNSKTYYLIYTGDGINSQLTSPAINDIVGTQNPTSANVINDALIGTPVNLPIGFGSYLFGIIPQSDATAAGAFSYSMQQIRNIKYCNFSTFAQTVRSLETVAGLPLVGGTTKPVDETLADNGLAKIALGSGVYGSYTMSDLFGSMSGLPYPWKLIYERITELQTTKLQNIYRENFLAITWEGAAVTVQYSTGPGPTYTVTGVTLTESGGGYGRGGAPAPTITISGGSGATATCTIGTDDSDAGPNGTGTFGRVTSVTLTSAGSPSATIPTITIEYPPTATLPVQTSGLPATGGTNTASGTVGWPATMNAVVQDYIDQANLEIAAIREANPITSVILNTYWNICGSQLKREQRARYIAFLNVPVIPVDSSTVVRKDYYLNPYPSSLFAFTDAVPTLALNTKPHMSAQTLEAIADLTTAGGQSLIAFMRESRNKYRLLESGIPQDNNLNDSLTDQQNKQLITNGVIPDSSTGEYTLAAWANNRDPNTGNVLYPVPYGSIMNDRFMRATELSFGDIVLDPSQKCCCGITVNSIVPVGVVTPQELTTPYTLTVPLEINNAIPIELDTSYTSSTLLPASLTITDAINQISRCNCNN